MFILCAYYIKSAAFNVTVDIKMQG